MNTKQVYYLKKFAQAERTAKKAVETTVSHRSLSEFGAALGKQDHILYGRGSVVKNANTRGMGGGAVAKQASDGSIADFSSSLGYEASEAIPYVRLVTAPANAVGNVVGLIAPAKKLSKDVTPWTMVPGVGRARTTIRRRQRDKELSGGKRDRSAYLHELGGVITNTLLMGLLGAGAGAGIVGLAGKKDAIGDAALAGLYTGATTGVLAHLAGGLGGVFTGDKEQRKQYLTGNNMWKNYLIPGYAAYQHGSGIRDVLDNG